MDQELRHAERRLAATGRVDDHARLLTAQLRAGLLDEERLTLAAQLGHAAAASVARAEPAAADPHPWQAEVRAALARRLLDVHPVAPAVARRHELRGPPHTNDGRRFLLPPHEELIAALGGAELWELRCDYGESETTILLRGARARFADLAGFWVEVGLTHEHLSGTDEGWSWASLARRYLASPEEPARPLDDPRESAACGQHGFAPSTTVAGLRRLLPAGPFVRALRLRDRWNDVLDVLESSEALVIASWDTGA